MRVRFTVKFTSFLNKSSKNFSKIKTFAEVDNGFWGVSISTGTLPNRHYLYIGDRKQNTVTYISLKIDHVDVSFHIEKWPFYCWTFFETFLPFHMTYPPWNRQHAFTSAPSSNVLYGNNWYVRLQLDIFCMDRSI